MRRACVFNELKNEKLEFSHKPAFFSRRRFSDAPRIKLRAIIPDWDQMQTYQLETFLSESFPTPPDYFCCTTIHGIVDPDAGPLLYIFSRKTALSVQKDEHFKTAVQPLQQVGQLKIVLADEPLSFEEWDAFCWQEVRASAVITDLLAVKKLDHRLMLLNPTQVLTNDPKSIVRRSSQTGRNRPEGTVSEICDHCLDVLTRHPDGDRAAIRYDMLMGPHSGYR
jgi:hypothetical protein